jgi:hypothetical protein
MKNNNVNYKVTAEQEKLCKAIQAAIEKAEKAGVWFSINHFILTAFNGNVVEGQTQMADHFANESLEPVCDYNDDGFEFKANSLLPFEDREEKSILQLKSNYKDFITNK